jgi:hypothetical protein
MDDSSSYSDDLPREIVVDYGKTRAGASTTSSTLPNDGSSLQSSASTKSSKIKPSNIIKTCKPILLQIPSKEMMDLRWVSWPVSEKFKKVQQQSSPRLPQRSRSQPLQRPKELFQIGTATRKTNTWTDVMEDGQGDDDDIQGTEKRVQCIGRTKSDGPTTFRKHPSSQLSSRSAQVRKSL